MVTYFNKTDLTRFGNYLLSEERRQLVFSHPEKSDEEKRESLKSVSHADIENWIEKEKSKSD